MNHKIAKRRPARDRHFKITVAGTNAINLSLSTLVFQGVSHFLPGAVQQVVGFSSSLDGPGFDAVGAAEILIEAVPEDDAWLAIADRLTRAVHAEEDDRN